MITSRLDFGGRRRRRAVLVGAGIALAASGGLVTAAAVAASSLAQAAPLGVTQVQPATVNPTPSPAGSMMGGSGGGMMDDDDWGWHHGSVMTRTQARHAAGPADRSSRGDAGGAAGDGSLLGAAHAPGLHAR